MAEFCKKCASNFGFEPDAPPLLCEGCGRYIPKPLPFWKKVLRFFMKKQKNNTD